MTCFACQPEIDLSSNFRSCFRSSILEIKMATYDLRYLSMNLTLYAGIASHLLLFVCFIKDPLKCSRNCSTYFVMNLALSDLIVCTVTSIKFFTSSRQLKETSYILSSAAVLISLFSLFSIAIDRYILTIYPFKHRVLITKRQTAIWIGSIWVISIFDMVIELIFGANEVYKQSREAVGIIIPWLTGIIYGKTYHSLRKEGRILSQQNRAQRQIHTQEKFLKTIIIVTFVQISALVPTTMYFLASGSSKESGPVIKFVFFQMYCLNFAINPFLYVWRLRNYRKTFRLIYCKKLC